MPFFFFFSSPFLIIITTNKEYSLNETFSGLPACLPNLCLREYFASDKTTTVTLIKCQYFLQKQVLFEVNSSTGPFPTLFIICANILILFCFVSLSITEVNIYMDFNDPWVRICLFTCKQFNALVIFFHGLAPSSLWQYFPRDNTRWCSLVQNLPLQYTFYPRPFFVRRKVISSTATRL